MNALARVDSFCLGSIVSRCPIGLRWNGIELVGTVGARDSMRMLESGGVIDDTTFSILLPTDQFADASRPREHDPITVYLDGNGAPCSLEDKASELSARITTITRTGASLTLQIRSDKR